MTDFDPQEATWRKSTASGGGNDGTTCLEATATDDTTWVRDSKNRPGPRLAFAGRAWRAFLVRITER